MNKAKRTVQISSSPSSRKPNKKKVFKTKKSIKTIQILKQLQ